MSSERGSGLHDMDDDVARIPATDASVEITELTVAVGSDVTFAHTLLRCGTRADCEEQPDRRLLLIVGLRKLGDRWIVPHDLHSVAPA